MTSILCLSESLLFPRIEFLPWLPFRVAVCSKARREGHPELFMAEMNINISREHISTWEQPPKKMMFSRCRMTLAFCGANPLPRMIRASGISRWSQSRHHSPPLALGSRRFSLCGGHDLATDHVGRGDAEGSTPGAHVPRKTHPCLPLWQRGRDLPRRLNRTAD